MRVAVGWIIGVTLLLLACRMHWFSILTNCGIKVGFYRFSIGPDGSHLPWGTMVGVGHFAMIVTTYWKPLRQNTEGWIISRSSCFDHLQLIMFGQVVAKIPMCGSNLCHYWWEKRLFLDVSRIWPRDVQAPDFSSMVLIGIFNFLLITEVNCQTSFPIMTVPKKRPPYTRSGLLMSVFFIFKIKSWIMTFAKRTRRQFPQWPERILSELDLSQSMGFHKGSEKKCMEQLSCFVILERKGVLRAGRPTLSMTWHRRRRTIKGQGD